MSPTAATNPPRVPPANAPAVSIESKPVGGEFVPDLQDAACPGLTMSEPRLAELVATIRLR